MPLLLFLSLLGCGSVDSGAVAVNLGQYWIEVPAEASGPLPAVVFLQAQGQGERLFNDDALLADYAANELIAVFPDGWGAPEDDWNVGNNRDDIERDDAAFIDEVAQSLAKRSDIADLWLAGFSKGGSMAYKVGCEGNDRFAGLLTGGGGWEKPVPVEGCTTEPRPIEHTQGTEDDRWPAFTADDPDSSHLGLFETMALMPATDETCLESPGFEGDCTVWPDCPVDVRICPFEGGHELPSDAVSRYRAAIDRLSE